jgi:AraC-like DNA-binding protein
LGHARPAPEEHTLPASHALHLAELVKRWNISRVELFRGLDLADDWLTDPDARVPVPTLVKLMQRARAMTGEQGLGFYLGLHMRVSAHGYLGFAAMTAATVRDALELAARFSPTRTTALGFRLQEGRDVASLVIEEHADFGAARDVVIPAVMVGFWQMGNTLTGRELGGTADLVFPEPEYFSRFASLIPDVRFSQPLNQLVFQRDILDLPMKTADAAAQRLAQEQCERALDALGYGGQIVGRVRALVAKKGGGVRSLDEVAAVMHVSARTLKRKLKTSGYSYSALLAEQQRDRAMLLLRSPDLCVEEVAERLGYSDVANFTRAFRRWTGTTPAAYRRSGSAKRSW